MNEKIKRQLRILTLAAAVGAFAGLSGCASTGSVEGLEARINAVAADAKTEATAARAEAAAAKAEAAAANAKANEAINTANEANRRSIDTETKIDRMFKKAMHK